MIKTTVKNHEHYMQKCIDLAIIAKQQGESPVGSVIVKNGEIIAEGFEGAKAHNDITLHAEVVAIRKGRQTDFKHSVGRTEGRTHTRTCHNREKFL